MFDQLYERPFTVALHRKGPMLEERVAFLMHLASQGYSRIALQLNARYLLAIAQMLGPASRPRKAEWQQGQFSKPTVDSLCEELFKSEEGG